MSNQNRKFLKFRMLCFSVFLIFNGLIFIGFSPDSSRAANDSPVKVDNVKNSSLPIPQVSGPVASARSLESAGKDDLILAFGYENDTTPDQNDSRLHTENINPFIEPGAMAVLGAGLIGLVFIIRWRLNDFLDY